MQLLHTIAELCPCCNAPIELVVDSSVPLQRYVEDCEVCCQPLIVTVSAQNPEEPQLTLAPEND